MTARARPVGGRLVTPTFVAMLMFWAFGTAAGLVRFTRGLGAVAAMNDGYPWGLWIAFDVVVGTGLASGGYAVAILAYVMNRGRYHPLVRPALLTSALGYSVAAVAIVFDVGRFWNLWKVPLMPWRWNGTSVLLEVALCVMLYVLVLWIELAPAVLERWADGSSSRLREAARRALPALERALPFVIALGLLLPTMHQSSLGSLLLVAGRKMNGLWHTPLLPLTFLLTSLGMGYAIVVVESVVSSFSFRREPETAALSGIGRVAGGVSLAFVGVRFADAAWHGHLVLALYPGVRALVFWIEVLLFVGAAILLLHERARTSLARQLEGAMLLLAAGALYRIDAYLVAFNPGPGYSYFPSMGELAITLGLVATETMAYLVVVRKFPILGGATVPRREPAGALVKEGAYS